MHRLRNHRSFGSVAGTEVAVALASIVLPPVARMCQFPILGVSSDSDIRRHGLTKSMSNSQSGSMDN